jgi:hypothetical protein
MNSVPDARPAHLFARISVQDARACYSRPAPMGFVKGGGRG